MRKAFLVLLLLLIGAGGYAYYRNPAACQKLLGDLRGVATTGFAQLKTDAGPVLASMSSNAAPAAPAPPPTPMPAVPVVAPTPASIVTGHLVTADGSAYTFPAAAPASSLQHVAFYYSAQWCPPCHAFTPVLVEWYKKFKPAHPDFELIFVSDDHDKASWLAYMKEMAMPWPAYSFDDLQQDDKDIKKFAGSGIPDLVLVDATGQVLADSFTATGQYLGPQHVIDEIEKQLGSGTTAPLPAAAASVATPPPAQVKTWSPPDVMPAQPNWTWTTSDGTTYQDVVVTKIGPETVSITHSMGVAHDIPIANLPPDVQQKLNYDPVAATAAREEAKREDQHPYFPFAQRAAGQELARQMHRPVAWMETLVADLTVQDAAPNSEADLSLRALNRLKKHAIVIVADGNNDLGGLPPVVLAQMFILDDGPIPGGHHFYAPKTVLTDPDATKALGRISQTQLMGGGDAAIDEALAAIPAEPAPASAPATNAPQ